MPQLYPPEKGALFLPMHEAHGEEEAENLRANDGPESDHDKRDCILHPLDW